MEIDSLLHTDPMVMLGSANEKQLGENVSRLGDGGINFEDEKLKKVARDFEAIFVNQILDKMKDTIPEDEEEESSTGQIKGLYWNFMADAVAERGGFGLWRSIYEQMGGGEMKSGVGNEAAVNNLKLDESI